MKATNSFSGDLTVIMQKLDHAAIGFVHSWGANVGNLGHGGNQLNSMIKTFQSYLHRKTLDFLTTPLPSTELPPHFGTTSVKSTPAHVSNHDTMILEPLLFTHFLKLDLKVIQLRNWLSNRHYIGISENSEAAKLRCHH